MNYLKALFSGVLILLMCQSASAWYFVRITGGGPDGHRDVSESHFLGLHILKCAGSGSNACGWSNAISFQGNNGNVSIEAIMNYVANEYESGNYTGQASIDGIPIYWHQFTDGGEMGYEISIDADAI
jgi:hypothetical protein